MNEECFEHAESAGVLARVHTPMEKLARRQTLFTSQREKARERERERERGREIKMAGKRERREREREAEFLCLHAGNTKGKVSLYR